VRRLRPESMWPEPGASPGGAELVHRWEALLDKAPRLRPWVDQMLGRHRLRLQESGAPGFEIEQTLWQELAHWLADFEALPGFAVSAIAVTLEDDGAHEVDPDFSTIAAEPVAASPEQAVGELETLLSDAAFALAFHCVDARLRPRLPASGELARVPESDWFALLRASARPPPALTPQVAITLVLHLLSPEWARNPATCRHAALRLFLGPVRDDEERQSPGVLVVPMPGRLVRRSSADDRADARDRVRQPGSVLTRRLALRLARIRPRPAEHPVVQSLAALAEPLVRTVVRACDVPVDRHRDRCKNLRHPSAPPRVVAIG